MNSKYLKEHYKTFEFKQYGDKLQQLVDLGFEIEDIWIPDCGEVCIAFKEDVIIGDGSEFFFKWPIECLSYLKERFDVNNDLED